MTREGRARSVGQSEGHREARPASFVFARADAYHLDTLCRGDSGADIRSVPEPQNSPFVPWHVACIRVAQELMQIWMSNSHAQVAYERDFFAVVCDALISRRGAQRVAERFQLLVALASLPWLDQPRLLEPTRLIFEIHEAWEELWALRLQEVAASPNPKAETRRLVASSLLSNTIDSDVFGRYLARPLHELTVFAASAGEKARVRVATHPRLIAEPGSHRAWRVIQGGLSRGAATAR